MTETLVVETGPGFPGPSGSTAPRGHVAAATSRPLMPPWPSWRSSSSPH